MATAFTDLVRHYRGRSAGSVARDSQTMVIEVVDKVNAIMAPTVKWLWLSMIPLLLSVIISADSAKGMT